MLLPPICRLLARVQGGSGVWEWAWACATHTTACRVPSVFPYVHSWCRRRMPRGRGAAGVCLAVKSEGVNNNLADLVILMRCSQPALLLNHRLGLYN